MRRSSRLQTITPALLRGTPLPLDGRADKDQRGSVLVIGGTRQVPGAAILASVGALRAGAGKLQIGVPESVSLYVATAIPEALVMPLKERSGTIAASAAREVIERAERVDAIALGPGMPQNGCEAFVCDVVKGSRKPVVLDAGALSACARTGDLGGIAVLTPHAGEMATLLACDREKIEADPERFATAAAQRFNAIVALKGPATYIAEPHGRCMVNRAGHVGLA
ncbi:MAG: NAD(P)H-hydrate dehydratase, partial [Candidatus Eremiobacteraeota bacterium]|nr:NAD(P)H-hydrate dehydratase [Candidatus Eremiobacteraeota bacterium]